MSNLTAIDPGTTHSHVLIFSRHNQRIRHSELVENSELIRRLCPLVVKHEAWDCYIEAIASYGMAVGAEVFTTCLWSGRFYQVLSSCNPRMVFRRDVKLHICASPNAKDANIRQAIIDRFGGKEAAIGNKKSPGPLYGVSKHAWAALALALTGADQPAVGFNFGPPQIIA